MPTRLHKQSFPRAMNFFTPSLSTPFNGLFPYRLLTVISFLRHVNKHVKFKNSHKVVSLKTFYYLL